MKKLWILCLIVLIAFVIGCDGGGGSGSGSAGLTQLSIDDGFDQDVEVYIGIKTQPEYSNPDLDYYMGESHTIGKKLSIGNANTIVIIPENFNNIKLDNCVFYYMYYEYAELNSGDALNIRSHADVATSEIVRLGSSSSSKQKAIIFTFISSPSSFVQGYVELWNKQNKRFIIPIGFKR